MAPDDAAALRLPPGPLDSERDHQEALPPVSAVPKVGCPVFEGPASEHRTPTGCPVSRRAAEFDPFGDGYQQDPPEYVRWAREQEPVFWSPQLGYWVVSRYEDVKAVCLDATMSSDRLRPFFAALPSAEAQRIGELIRVLTLWMVFRDPPEHTRLRKIAAKVFHVRSVNALRPNIETLTAWLLARIGDREDFDFIAEFAGPLPALVIMDMLGVPREELARIKALSDEMALFIGSTRDAPEKYSRAEAATHEMAELFRAMVSRSRAPFRTRPGFSVALVLTTPPFPYTRKQVSEPVGLPVIFDADLSSGDRRHLHYGEVGLDAGGQLVTSGVYGWTMVVSGVGPDLATAKSEAYRIAGKVFAPNLRYRLDIADRLIAGDWARLDELGLLDPQA